MTSLNAKRTRSQLTLPALNPDILGRSPLKDARLALRHAPNHPHPRIPHTLRNMDEEVTDGEDEILLSPKIPNTNKNKKRPSDGHEDIQDENGNPRESKRAKMDSLPLPSLVLADTENHPGPERDQKTMNAKSPIQRERLVESQSPRGYPSASPSNPVPLIDRKIVPTSSSPLRYNSLVKGIAPGAHATPKSNSMVVDATPDPNSSNTSYIPRPLGTPSTPRPAPSPGLAIQSQTPQGLNLGSGPRLGQMKGTGINGPMSPLTPLPSTPTLFGGPLRAFTTGSGLGFQGKPKPLQRERSKMNIVTTNSDSAPSTPARPSSSAGTSRPPQLSSTSTGLPTSTSNPVLPTSSAATSKHTGGRSRSATVVSNGAGAWGPKPKTPSVLKMRSVRGRGARVGGTGGRRVTRSVSMKEKMEESVNDDEPNSDSAAGVRKSFSFTFKASTSSGPGIETAKGKIANMNTKMKQLSMKDFITGSSTSTPARSTGGTGTGAPPLSHTKPKSRPTSAIKPNNKPKPAWNASAGSPSNLAPPRPVRPASSLSTLSIALEKLSLPRPVRPNTSIGFNDNGHGLGGKVTKDDGIVGLGVSVGGAKSLKRCATVGDKSFSSTSIGGGGSGEGSATVTPRGKTPAPGTNGTGTSPAKVVAAPSSTKYGNPSPKRPSSMFAPQIGSSIRSAGTAANAGVSTGAKSIASTDRGPRLFGPHGHGPSAQSTFGGGRGGGMVTGGGGLGRKVSKKTSLPSVMASPLRGGNGWDSGPMDEDGEEEYAGQGDVSMRSAADISVVMNDIDDEAVRAGAGEKEKERSKNGWKQNASRRASMASQSLTQSLSNIPRTPSKGSMGPPRTPGRAVSFTYPSVASGSKDKRDEERRPTGREETSAGTVGMQSAPSVLGRVRSGTDGHVGTSRSARIFAQEKDAELEAAQNEKDEDEGNGNGTLSLLRECIIFVDVRTDGGDDAGGLFVDMLKGMGARILTRVGPSCTHIVYKNGLMSTLTRYRLLQDPKPLVVGIGWVVECVEQRARVEEARFSVDLGGINVAGTNKRRRSMLPKDISGEEGFDPNESQEGQSSHVDVSMEAPEADSSMRSLDDEDLPPLEKARRRRLLLTSRA